MQDILLADHPELEPFRTEDEDQITFPRVQRMVLRLDEILSEHLKELAADPELPDKIKAMADHLQSARIPSFYDLLDGKHLPEWSREAMSFVMLSHLHTALLAFGEMLALVVTALDPKSPRPVRLLDLFAIVGIQTGENAASDILAKDLRSVFEVASTQGTAP